MNINEYNKYAKMVTYLVSKQHLENFKDPKEARKEFTSEAWIAVMYALKSFNPALNVKESTWVYNTIRFYLTKFYSKALSIENSYYEVEEKDFDLLDPISYEEDINTIIYTSQALQEVFSNISEEERSLLSMIFIKEIPISTIARERGRGISEFHYYIKSILKRLKRKLALLERVQEDSNHA